MILTFPTLIIICTDQNVDFQIFYYLYYATQASTLFFISP